MHLVIVHGYLLTGTGSNVYTANVAESWKQQGHAVTVLCQDPRADALAFVDELIVGTHKIPSTPPASGTVRVVVPDIGGLLLVYNYDRYEGYRVKTMANCTLDEIEANITCTVEGLKRVLAQGVDRVLTNHAILSPVIAFRACRDTATPYDSKIHGSSIIFSIRPRPELKRYAIEGIRACQKVVVGSSYVARLLLETFQSAVEEFQHKLVTIPPGMNPEIFKLADGVQENQKQFLARVHDSVQRRPNGRKATAICLPPPTPNLHQQLVSLADTYDQRSIDADLEERWVPFKEDEPVICFFGKFLHTKGVAELLMCFPLVLTRIPKARLLLIGCGSYREHLEGMIAAMRSGNLDAFRAYSRAGAFLDEVTALQEKKFFRQLSSTESSRITITGMLEHEQLREILPLASMSVVSSKAPEAFGMVSVEAMAAGVLPLCNRHTGIADVLDVVKETDPELEHLMGIDIKPGGAQGAADGAFLIEQLPEKIETVLHFLYPNGFADHRKRREISYRLRKIAVSKFSWNDISKRLLEDSKPHNDQGLID